MEKRVEGREQRDHGRKRGAGLETKKGVSRVAVGVVLKCRNYSVRAPAGSVGRRGGAVDGRFSVD